MKKYCSKQCVLRQHETNDIIWNDSCFNIFFHYISSYHTSLIVIDSEMKNHIAFFVGLISIQWLNHSIGPSLTKLIKSNVTYPFFSPVCQKKRTQQCLALMALGTLWNHNRQEPQQTPHYQPGSTWETEIMFTLYSPLTELIIAGERCTEGLESITIYPWTMINDPVGTNSKWLLSNSVRKLICHQTSEYILQIL